MSFSNILLVFIAIVIVTHFTGILGFLINLWFVLPLVIAVFSPAIVIACMVYIFVKSQENNR